MSRQANSLERNLISVKLWKIKRSDQTDCGFSIGTWMSYNTQEMSEIRVSSKIDRTALTDTLLIPQMISFFSQWILSFYFSCGFCGTKQIVSVFIFYIMVNKSLALCFSWGYGAIRTVICSIVKVLITSS